MSVVDMAVLKYITVDISPFQKNPPSGISVLPAPTRNGAVVFIVSGLIALTVVLLIVVVRVEVDPLYTVAILYNVS